MSILRSKRARRVIAFLIPLLIVLQTGIYFAMQVRPPRFTGDMLILDNEGNPLVVSGANRKPNFFTLLAVGRDDGALTDSIALFVFDIDSEQIHMVSVPRDTMVAHSVNKINASHALGGMDRLKRDVSDIFGFRPDRYVLIEIDGFEEIIDVLGGVEVDVPHNMRYRDPFQNLVIDIPAGRQRLNGQQAGHFARYRSGFADADLGRVRSQQHLLTELFRQSLTPANLFRIRPLVTAVSQNMQTDLTIGEMVWLVNQGRQIGPDNFTTQTLPVTERMYNGISFVFVNRTQTLELINTKLNPFTIPITNIDLNPRTGGGSGQPTTPTATPTPTTPAVVDAPTVTPVAATPVPLPTLQPTATPVPPLPPIGGGVPE